MKARWLQRALDDSVDAAAYIAADRPGVASSWREGLIDVADRIAAFPESGRMVPELESPQMRELLYTSFRVIYVLAKPPVIVAVRHSRRLLKKRELLKWGREARNLA
ncbi:MAG TPA: type II toxin-antitoxin system RelE/ParE family toxin [Longimicrobium sp.]|nr:type II toxin-antitoxin system RelE/ParE family toxin [Longimicrobium sp.]